MTRRVTTRLSDPVLRLVLRKASDEKKSISEVISELVSSSMSTSEKDEFNFIVKSISELTSSLSDLRQMFLIHTETSEREFKMIFNILILQNEIAKSIMQKDQYDAAWERYSQKYVDYTATGRISL